MDVRYRLADQFLDRSSLSPWMASKFKIPTAYMGMDAEQLDGFCQSSDLRTIGRPT